MLGVGFDSLKMEWFLAQEKADKVTRRCHSLVSGQHADLKQIQEVMGSVNDLAQMSPLLRFYKRSGNAFLKRFGGSENILLAVPQDVKKDMAIIAKVAEYSVKGLPVADSVSLPKLSALGLKFFIDFL